MDTKPFIFGIETSGEHFTDREKETARLRQNFQNGINTILISPRRWGKTSLVHKVCNMVESEHIHTVRLDIFSCRSEKDFYDAFATAVLKQTSSRIEEWLENIRLFLSRISPRITMGPDPMSDFSISLEYSPKPQDVDEKTSPQCMAAAEIRLLLSVRQQKAHDERPLRKQQQTIL